MDDTHNSGGELHPGLASTIVGPALSEQVGVQIGPYKLMEQIGEGGFGLVFVAQQQKPVQRRVALKVIKPGMDTQDVIARFEAERQALALMDHPNIARVLDAGTTGSGRPYFVMELVPGVPITEYCDRNHQSPRERLELFVDVCNAVQHAHQKGIIHRDIKPSNVLVTLQDGKPIVKVIDFGVAKALHQKLTDRTIYTRFAQMVGTPLYMSPEQAEMSGLDVDTRTDIYSLGVLMYELLTGSTPFDKKRVSQAAYGELIRMIREEDPPKPSTRLSQSTASLPAIAEQRKTEPARLSKMFRGDLDWITMKALEKDRMRRYETANAFAADVQRYLADEPVEASPPSATYRFRKLLRRYRRAAITAGAFIGLLLVGVVVTGWLAVRQAAARAAADHSAHLAQIEAEKADRRVELAIDAIENFRTAVDGNLDVKNLPENEGLRKTLLQAPLSFYQKLRDDLRAGGDVGPETQSKLADAYLKLASIDREIGSQTDALTAYGEAETLLQDLIREAPPAQLSKLHIRLAQVLAERGELQMDTKELSAAAMTSLQSARESWESALHENADDVQARVGLAKTLDNLAGLESRKGNVDAALADLRQSLTVLEEGRRRTPDNIEVGLLLADTHLLMGNSLRFYRSRLAEAVDSAETALHIAEPLAQAHAADVACQMQLSQVYRGLSKIYMDKGAHDQAFDAASKRLELVERLIQSRPTANHFKQMRIEALDQVATEQSDLGRNTEALANFQRGRELATDLVHDNPTNIPFKQALRAILSHTAGPLYALGRVPEALAVSEACASVLEEIARAEPDNIDSLRHLGGTWYNCGILNNELGRTDAALSAYYKAVELQERLARSYPDDPSLSFDLASTLGNIAGIHAAEIRRPEALAGYQRASEILQKLVVAHPENADFRTCLLRTQLNVGCILRDMDQNADALKVLTAALAGCEQFAREHPGVVQNQKDAALGSIYVGKTLKNLGKLDEAAIALQKSVDTYQNLRKENPGDPEMLSNLDEGLGAQSELELARKHPAAAVQLARSAVQLFANLSAPSPKQIYGLAGSYARLAAAGSVEHSGMTAQEVRDTFDKAMATLNRALSAGFRDLPTLRTDKAIDSLRKRPDFQQLMKELEKK
jgi:serine/threonine protein kinase